MNIKKNLANIITFTRIIGTILLFFTETLSTSFFIIYAYSGISDVLDGYIARKFNISSAFGRKLDSISDLLFYTTMMIKIWPYLVEYLPIYVWFIIWFTVAIRIISYIYVFIRDKHLMANHTIFNKISGMLIFLLPFFIETKIFIKYCILVSLEAFVAGIYEFVYELKGDSHNV